MWLKYFDFLSLKIYFLVCKWINAICFRTETALNDLLWLICRKTKQKQNKLFVLDSR